MAKQLDMHKSIHFNGLWYAKQYRTQLPNACNPAYFTALRHDLSLHEVRSLEIPPQDAEHTFCTAVAQIETASSKDSLAFDLAHSQELT